MDKCSFVTLMMSSRQLKQKDTRKQEDKREGMIEDSLSRDGAQRVGSAKQQAAAVTQC